MQCNAMQCKGMQCNAKECNAMQRSAMQRNAMQYMECNIWNAMYGIQCKEMGWDGWIE